MYLSTNCQPASACLPACLPFFPVVIYFIFPSQEKRTAEKYINQKEEIRKSTSLFFSLFVFSFRFLFFFSFFFLFGLIKKKKKIQKKNPFTPVSTEELRCLLLKSLSRYSPTHQHTPTHTNTHQQHQHTNKRPLRFHTT